MPSYIAAGTSLRARSSMEPPIDDVHPALKMTKAYGDGNQSLDELPAAPFKRMGRAPGARWRTS